MFEFLKKFHKETDEQIFDRILTEKIKEYIKCGGGLGRSEFCSFNNKINSDNKDYIFRLITKAVKTIIQDMYYDSANNNYELEEELQILQLKNLNKFYKKEY